MARMKQAVGSAPNVQQQQGNGSVSQAPPPPPPPPPPPSGGKGGASSQPYQSAGRLSDSNILSPSILLKQKNALKNSSFNPVQLDRAGLMESSSDRTLYLTASLDYMRTQSQSANVTALSFAGIEQLNDAFLFLLYRKEINMPQLERISLSGCYNLTDAGIKWLTKAFQKVKSIDLDGCKKLTEASLVSIIKSWEKTLWEINIMGTNVGMIPPGYEGGIKTNGCPMISPTEIIYNKISTKMPETMNRPSSAHTVYKMVILTEDSLPWSPLSVMTKEEDVKAKKNLRVKMNHLLDKNIQVNMFEVPIESGFGELLVSEGCVIVLPYLLAEDGPDQDYADTIVKNMVAIFTKCHDCCFVLMGLSEEPRLDGVADRYKNLIVQQFKKKIDKLDKDVDMSTMSRQSYSGFYNQESMASGQTLITAGQQISNTGSLLRPGTNLLMSIALHVKSDVIKPLQKLMSSAVKSLHHHFPWHFIAYQSELKDAVLEVEKCQFPLSSLKKLNDEVVPKNNVMTNFTNYGNTFPYLGKICSFMSTMGKVLYYPDLDERPALTDFTFLESVYEKLLCTKAPSRATWRFLGSSSPCWTMKDLEGICPDKHTLSLLVELLESYGLLIKLPGDQWTTQIDSMFAYVLYKDLPYFPEFDVEEYWPEAVPMDEIQVERYYTFMPGVPDSFMANLIRNCMDLGGVRLIWNKGIIIQKGPITILLELLTNYDNNPVLFVGARLINSMSKIVEVYDLSPPSLDPFLPMLWLTLNIYKTVVHDLILRYKIYAVESVPCSTCLPSKNRYKTVNARESEVWMIQIKELRNKSLQQREMSCRNDGSLIIKKKLLGPDTSIHRAFPTHYYLGCLPSFSAHNRCMFCQNCAVNGAMCEGNLQNKQTSWNCSCECEAQMCDKCGMCQRCVTLLARLQGSVSPTFQKKGSMVSLRNNAKHTMSQELTPNYSPFLEVHFVRGAIIDLEIKMGSTRLVYNTGNGSMTEHVHENQISQSDESWKCREGYSISVHAKFSQEDLDNMEIVFLLRGAVIYTYTCSTQGCSVSITSENPMSVVVYMPQLKVIEEQEIDNFGDRKMCTYSTYSPELALSSSIEALMVQGKQYIGNALFQAGGVNYSGSSYITLPHQVTEDILRYPTFNSFKQHAALHLLCYTRTKICDVMSFGGSQAVPESWSVYRMLHLLDEAGFTIDADLQNSIEDKAGTLLWAWHFLFKLLPQVMLPKSCDNIFLKNQEGEEEEEDEIEEEKEKNKKKKTRPEKTIQETKEERSKLEAGLHDLIELGHWRLLVGLDVESILQTFENTFELLEQAQALQKVTKANLSKTVMQCVASKFNVNTLYLCPGHHASMKVEEGLTQIQTEIYGNYSNFLLSIDFPSNQLTEIPEEMFKALPNLAEFDCSNNFIEILPSSISYCTKLYSLTIAENNLSDLPESLLECKELFRLDINSNMMLTIPAVVTKMTQLQRLYAQNMFLTSLPDDIGNLVNLEKLYVNGNCFTSLPKSFSKLKSLSDLGISGVPWLTQSKSKKVMSFQNFVQKVSMWRLDRWLEQRDLESQTGVSSRDELFKLFDEDSNGVLNNVEIGKLNAALYNMFPRFGYKGDQPPEDDTPSGFPVELLECTSLEYLNMYYQGIVHIPPEIGNLQELKMLNVSDNPNLLSVPAEVGTISSLTRLEMDECPLLKTPPKEIRAKGFSTTFAYLRRLMSGSMPCKRTKLMLVGLGGAGKTSLVNSLLSKDGKADLKHGEAITDGIDISTWTVRSGDENVTFSVWDFAGQTVYYNTHQFFLSNRAVYLLLWNVRLGYEHAGLDFWLSSISVQAPKAPIFVVGSHIDQVSKFELPINEMKARYKQIAGFHFVSSFTGKGIKELQENLFDVTLQQQYMGEQIPEVWLTFENNAIGARSSSNVIEYTALEKMANISGIFDKTEVYQAVQFLHELGSLQHFTTEGLKSKVVVNPQWIVDVMACVVSVKNSPIKEGRLQHKDIATVWADYPAELHDWLLKLTEEYDLTFPLQNEPVNLVPCLLSEKQPEFTWPELDKDSDIKANKMVYKFDYLPAGLFNRGQVRLHQISDSALIWKKGSLLKKNGHIALLQQTRASELIVSVQGPRPENMIFLVHEVFEGLISESFRGVTYDFLIPCPDCLRMVLKDPHMFAASTIRRAMELKAPFLQCIKYFHTISCVDLLACMPPDSHSDFDLHLVQSVRGLRDLRKDLAADIFMSYCHKDAPSDRKSVIHPTTVCEDLQARGYKCWMQVGKSDDITEMARALTDAAVFVTFISNDYVKDEDCVNIFKYARLRLRKPMVVISVGDNFEWQKNKLGILLSDEVFVNMIKSKREVYKSKFDELIKTLSSRTHRQIGIDPTPSCFFSYTWVNSAKAVELGTRRIPGAIGYGDPRDIKDYLEKNGVKCWIDVERVGQNGLFDDIAEGLLSAKVVVVCVSDEYATSPTCQIEFRYAANTLKLPIVLVVVGTKSKWRASEVGVLSLSYPVVSFQEKSETAYETLLKLVNENMTQGKESDKERKNRQNEEHKNLSFQELFELAQRKLLRQLCFYAEHQDVDVYPRLFIIDFVKTKSDDTTDTEKSEVDNKPVPEKPPLTRMMSIEEKSFTKKISELKAAFKVQRYCVHTLCEHDEGWHSCTEPIQLPNDFGDTLLEKFSPFIARVTAVMKHNKHFKFTCLDSEIGEDYVKWLEENPKATMSDYQQVYHDFRSMVINADSHRTMGKLARCRLPNGKTIWLCEHHRNSMKVTVLSTDTGSSSQPATTGGDDMFMIAALRSSDYKQYAKKFTSSQTAKRTKSSTDDGTVKSEKKSDMYTEYELLPDKKMTAPVIRSEVKVKKDADDLLENQPPEVEMGMETEVGELETISKLESIVKDDSKLSTLQETKNVPEKHMAQTGSVDKTEGLEKKKKTEQKHHNLKLPAKQSASEEMKDEVRPKFSKAKTIYGSERHEEQRRQQERPASAKSLSLPRPTVEKQKSKACNMM